MGKQRFIQFLEFMKGLSFSGMIIMENRGLESKISAMLEECGYQRSEDWKDVLAALNYGCSTFLKITVPLQLEEQELLSQYARRLGAIQIVDRSTQQIHSAFFSPYESQLVLLLDGDELNECERLHSIQDKVGVIERVDEFS